jgi:hypothetical protein
MTQYYEIKHKTSGYTDTIKGKIFVIFTRKGKNLKVTTAVCGYIVTTWDTYKNTLCMTYLHNYCHP